MFKKASSNHSKFIYLFYAYLFYHVYELPIDDTFFKNFISFNMLTTFIILYIVYYIFTNVKITTRLRVICRIKIGLKRGNYMLNRILFFFQKIKIRRAWKKIIIIIKQL